MFPRTTFNLFAMMLRMPQRLGLGISDKISIRLIGTPTVVILSICNSVNSCVQEFIVEE